VYWTQNASWVTLQMFLHIKVRNDGMDVVCYVLSAWGFFLDYNSILLSPASLLQSELNEQIINNEKVASDVTPRLRSKYMRRRYSIRVTYTKWNDGSPLCNQFIFERKEILIASLVMGDKKRCSSQGAVGSWKRQFCLIIVSQMSKFVTCYTLHCS